MQEEKPVDRKPVVLGKRSAQQMEIEFDKDEILKANEAAMDKSLNQTTTTADITQVISTQAGKKQQLVLAQDEDDADELFPEEDVVAAAPQQL